MNTLETYNKLTTRFGKANIDSVLCPCWDKELALHNPDGALNYPYRDFIDNLEWFLDILTEKKQ